MEDKEKSVNEDPQLNQEAHHEEIDNKETENAANSLESELAEQKDKFLRLFAEFDNYKKRIAKEQREFYAIAGKDIILEMISVKDDFERAIKSFEGSEDMSAIKEGINLIYDKLNKSIEKKGVKKIEAKGMNFDVEKHEAITEISVPDESQKGKVIDEIESGYIMHEKVIRFAKVVVGK
ncbi:MAG: nucleotide exchange factor GrpE [Chitinophagales bacterium]|jgi:molecular chaperone GrpE|nr:nucleotide exchange factor GrpE [Sphingobacteriales bacterium]